MKNRSFLLPSAIDQPSVLVVEDKVDEQLILHYILRQQLQGVLPVGATSGQQALTYLRNCYTHQHTLPGLILLDLYLPRRDDGWKLLRKLRAHPTYHSIPVVIISASTDTNDQEQSYHWGAALFITKPIRPQAWQEILRILPHQMPIS
ncbi:response regulator [Larkinella bovis]|uniref:Response regulator n=1 Tax=Larkinella bovis TaxID=683041 RepID=A0ABW0IGZ5_9BACT